MADSTVVGVGGCLTSSSEEDEVDPVKEELVYLKPGGVKGNGGSVGIDVETW